MKYMVYYPLAEITKDKCMFSVWDKRAACEIRCIDGSDSGIYLESFVDHPALFDKKRLELALRVVKALNMLEDSEKKDVKGWLEDRRKGGRLK